MSEHKIESESSGGTALAVQPAAEEQAPRQIVASRWSISVDRIMAATQGLPEFEREQLRWVGRFGAHANYSLADVAAMLKQDDGSAYSKDSLAAALTGRRAEQGVSLLPMARAIEAMRRRLEETYAGDSTTFVETRISRQVFALCDRARKKGRLAFLFGDTQLGKTSILSEYQRTHNHGSTYMVRMPTRGSMTHFLHELGSALRVPIKQREDSLRRKIFDCFDPSVLLIVDESHHTLFGHGPTTGMTLEFIRELHDRRKCGIVVCGTEVLRENLRSSRLLLQLWERRTPSLVLSLKASSYTPSDLAEFARAAGLDPAPDRMISVRNTMTRADGTEEVVTHRENPLELQARVVRGSLGAWIKVLEDARDWADMQGKGISWGCVVQAYCVGRAQEGGVA